MDRIDDERICFYLRNREDIDQWCALRQEASRALDTFLQESADEIEALAAQLGDDVVTRANLRGGRGGSYIRFFRKGWIDGHKVRAAIELGWRGSGAVFFPQPRREQAWVAVWVNRGARGGAELVVTARQEFSDRAKKLKLTSGSSTSSHPVWRYQSPRREFWKNLAPFRQQIIDDLQKFWDEFSGNLDDFLRESSE